MKKLGHLLLFFSLIGLCLIYSCSGDGDEPTIPESKPPTISLSNPNDEEVSAGASFSVEITATEGSAPLTDLDITTPNDRMTITINDQATFSYTFEDIAPVTEDTYHYSFTVYTRDGRTATASKNIIVNEPLVVFEIDESGIPDNVNVGEKVTIKGTVKATGGIASMILTSSSLVSKKVFNDAVDQETFTFEEQYVASFDPGEARLKIDVHAKLDLIRPYVWQSKTIMVTGQDITEYTVQMETQETNDQKSFFDSSSGTVMSKSEALNNPSLVDIVLYEDNGAFYLSGAKSVPAGTFDGWQNDRKSNMMPAETDERKGIYDAPSTLAINAAFVQYLFEDGGNDPETPVQIMEGGIYLVQTFNKDRDGVLKINALNSNEHTISVTLKFIDL